MSLQTEGKQTVIVVDDEAETAAMLGTMLQVSGYDVLRAHSPAKAMSLIQHHNPDLVLLDIMMPGVSGLELCRYLRRDPRYRELPVVIISAKSQPEDIREGMNAGATAYLTKPVAMKTLIQTIGTSLENN